MLNLAAHALYRAKADSRNHVVCYEEHVLDDA